MFNMVMRHRPKPLSAVWNDRRQDNKPRTGTRDEDADLLISHMIFADICYTVASSRIMSLEMAQRVTDNIVQCELKRPSGFGIHHELCQLQSPRAHEMLVTGSLQSNEADTMSAMRHRMNKAMSAMRADTYFHRNLRLSGEGNTRDTSRLYRPVCCTRRTPGAVRRNWPDTLHGLESRCPEMIDIMEWNSNQMPLEIHCQTQIRRARLKFDAHTAVFVLRSQC